MVGDVIARSNLPACQVSDNTRWSNCFATFTFGNGSKYISDYKDSIPNGNGTFLFAMEVNVLVSTEAASATGKGLLYFPVVKNMSESL